MRTQMLSRALENGADETREFGIFLLAGPASGSVPPRRDRITEFPAIAEAA